MSKTTRKQMTSARSRLPAGPGKVATATAETPDRAMTAQCNAGPGFEMSDPGNDARADAESMAQLGIYFDGRNYRYRDYRYGRLRDALAYARLMRSRHPDEAPGITPAHHTMVQPPSESQRELMRQFSISMDAGLYRLGDFRYDNLADAVSYARTCLRRHIAGQPEVGDASCTMYASAGAAQSSNELPTPDTTGSASPEDV